MKERDVIDALADDDTLIVSAAGPGETPAGCRRGGEPTAFGDVLFGKAFNPRPHRRHSTFDSAGWTGDRNGFGGPALMTDQPLLEPMLDHARITVVAAHLMPTSPAQRDRCKTATIDKQQRLLTLIDPQLHLTCQLF